MPKSVSAPETYPIDDDPIREARGIIHALLLSLPIWVALWVVAEGAALLARGVGL